METNPMSQCSTQFIRPFLIAVLIALWAQACLGQEAKAAAEQSPGYASPVKVFAALQQGWKDRDGETVYRCVTDRHRDRILLGEWCREFTLRYPGPQIKQIVSKHVDEKRRKELTREELPLKHYELTSVLVRSLKDKKATFVDLVKNLDERSRGEYTDGKLGEVSIDGNHAQGVLKIKDDPRRIVCHFVKEKQGWLFERVVAGQGPLMVVRPARGDVSWLSAGETVGDAPPDAEKSSPRSRPWTNNPAPKLESPQEAADAFQNAIWDNDPEAAWNCLTDGALGEHEWWFWLGMLMDPNAGPGATTPMVWYHDMDKWYRIVLKQGSAAGDDEMVKSELRALFESIRDRKVFFSAGIKGLCAHLHAVPKEHRKRPSFRDLEVKEDQAT
ncbi:MAG TPA: hypothetical protein VFB96_23180, partial [Pirellulaceae bacterium]|nr:hypothetical protein [Pirellulaceae bacterium]